MSHVVIAMLKGQLGISPYWDILTTLSPLTLVFQATD